MLGFFRSAIKSRIGVAIALIFLALIALSFAGADISGAKLGGSGNADRAATVGSTVISTDELQKAMTNALENARAENPTATMKDLIVQGGMDEVLNGLIDRAAIMEWSRTRAVGLGVSDRLVDSEIVKLPAFQGPDGKFSQTTYTNLLQQRGISDAALRDDLAKGLITRQALIPGGVGAKIPLASATRYLAVVKEIREGAIQFVPSAAYAPKEPPSEADVAAFYKANGARYERAERRAIRYATFDESAIKSVPAPGDAEVQARYKLGAAAFAASETRSFTQVIVPTEPAAKALAAEIAGGKSIEAAAGSKGLSASKMADTSRQKLQSEASPAVADAVYAAVKGKLAAPAKGALGWYVIRLDAVIQTSGKSLDQARTEITATLVAEKRRAALADLSAQFDDQFSRGTGLADAAKSVGLSLIITDPLQADGSVPGRPTIKPNADVTPLIQAAFAMEREGQPQVAELQAGARYVIFDVEQVTPAAPPPLTEVREKVMADLAMSRGYGAAKAASDKLLAALGRKTPLAEAVKALGVVLPAPQAVVMPREQLNSMGEKLPATLSLMFAMAQGTSKRLEVPGKAGWLIVSLNRIVPGQVAPNDPLLPRARAELGDLAGREYVEQLRAAVRDAVGVKRNDTSIAALRKQLLGG